MKYGFIPIFNNDNKNNDTIGINILKFVTCVDVFRLINFNLKKNKR
jgi:hypothetical protein